MPECNPDKIKHIKNLIEMCEKDTEVHKTLGFEASGRLKKLFEYRLEKCKEEAKELPIYKIKGKFYFRDERLNEYRNIKDPQDRKPIDSVDNKDLQKPTKEDSEMVYHKILKEATKICDKNPCDLKIKGKRDEFKKSAMPFESQIDREIRKFRAEQKESK